MFKNLSIPSIWVAVAISSFNLDGFFVLLVTTVALVATIIVSITSD